MEDVPCCLCGTKGRLFLEKVCNSINNDLFDLVVCPDCKIIWVNPRPAPSQLLKYYPPTYWSEKDESSKDRGLVEKLQDVFIKKRMENMLKPIRRFVDKGARLLDVGCGTGEITAILATMGYRVSGIDFSMDAVEYAKAVYGLNIDHGDFLKFPYEEGEFDAITLYGVLEHMPEPVGVLERCHKLLKPGGILVIKVPNIDSVQFSLFGEQWSGLMPPIHLYQFSPQSLFLMLHNARLKIRHQDHWSMRESPGLFVRSILPQLHPSRLKKYGAATGKGLLLRVTYLLGQLCVAPAVCLESMLKRGGMITVYSEKIA